jgi:hypothetical protein
MKNFIKIFGIIAVAAVLCLSVTGCPEDDSDVDINGTWKGTLATIPYTLIAKSSDNTWETSATITTGIVSKWSGTYTTSGDEVTFKVTAYKIGDQDGTLPSGGDQKATVSDNKFTLLGVEYTKQ